jgi:hypothetical protein
MKLCERWELTFARLTLLVQDAHRDHRLGAVELPGQGDLVHDLSRRGRRLDGSNRGLKAGTEADRQQQQRVASDTMILHLVLLAAARRSTNTSPKVFNRGRAEDQLNTATVVLPLCPVRPPSSNLAIRS